MRSDKVCIVGLWHLGVVSAACLADWGYQVVGIDENQVRIANLQKNIPPLFEPGLEELISSGLSSNRLKFSNNVSSAVSKALFVWITYDTPVNENDELDLSPITDAVATVAPFLQKETVLMISSQVPVGTCEMLWQLVIQHNPKAEGGIAYIPENLRLGLAIERFQHPDMLVIGADSKKTGDRVDSLLSSICSSKMRVSIRTAEMVKHSINAFLATSISLANELAHIGRGLGVNCEEVAKAMQLDPRIGQKACIKPGMGFSGGTLARDLKTLQQLGKQTRKATDVIDSVLKVNSVQCQLLVESLRDLLNLKQSTIGILGLTYTSQTSTLRRSQSLELIKCLEEAGCQVKAYDPKANLSELEGRVNFEISSAIEKCVTDCDAIILMTEWPEFLQLNFQKLQTLMRSPILIDPKSFLSQKDLKTLGFKYISMAGMGR